MTVVPGAAYSECRRSRTSGANRVGGVVTRYPVGAEVMEPSRSAPSMVTAIEGLVCPEVVLGADGALLVVAPGW